MTKKMMVIITVLMVGVVAGYADFIIGWGASYGFYNHNGAPTPILASGSSNSALVQLMYSPDNVADQAFEDGGSNPHYLDPIGNDVWLADHVVTEDILDSDTSYAIFSATTYNGVYSAGYIYARIFETTSANPVVGTWYLASQLVVAQNLTPPASPQAYDMSTGGVYTPNLQVAAIPEPATFVLALLGCIPFVVRFVRRRK